MGPLGPGGRRHGPDDPLIKACAGILLAPSASRERLTEGLFLGSDDDGVARLERAFDLVVACEALRERLEDAKVDGVEAALERGVIDDAEASRLRECEEAVQRVVMVDDFASEELSPDARQEEGRSARQRETQAVAYMS